MIEMTAIPRSHQGFVSFKAMYKAKIPNPRFLKSLTKESPFVK
jgi:hypothetical protein